MREIKFRAWIVDGNDPNQVWNEDGFPTKYSMCYNLAFDDYQPINDLLASVKHLMQYTGLKDKNGKEIYEGDILDCYRNGVVTFGEFYIEGYYKNYGWHIQFPDGQTSEDFNMRWLTVIGNIYENPELLDGGEK